MGFGGTIGRSSSDVVHWLSMGAEAKKIFEQALALPDEERAALADALNEVLGVDEEELSPEWKAEISRRIEAAEQGESQILPGAEVEARVRARLVGL